MNIKTLLTRTLSGAVYVALITSSILVGQIYFTLTFVALAALCIYEYHSLVDKNKNVSTLKNWGIFCTIATIGLLSTLLMSSYVIVFISLSILFLFIIITFCIDIFRKPNNSLINSAYNALGQVYITAPFLAIFIIEMQVSPAFLLAIFIFVWANDTFAYLIGSAIGKHHMCESISPKKSWEGFFGGLAGALIGGFLYWLLSNKMGTMLIPETNLWQWLVLAVIVVIFGTLGDLFESKIKRSVGVKDSGKIMPGHGGMLDRLDSILFAVIPSLIFILAVF